MAFILLNQKQHSLQGRKELFLEKLIKVTHLVQFLLLGALRLMDHIVSAVPWNAAHEINEDMEGVDTCFWHQEWSFVPQKT